VVVAVVTMVVVLAAGHRRLTYLQACRRRFP
jgi:hypothetical protein